MIRRQPIILVACLGAGVAALPGCAPPMLLASAGFQALSNGTAVYVNGELEVAYRVPFEIVWTATQRAFEDLQFRTESARQFTDVKALLFAREEAGRSIEVSVVRKSPVVTKVTVRVGVVGDQAISRLVMDRIEAKMQEMEREGTPPPELPPQAPVFPKETVPK